MGIKNPGIKIYYGLTEIITAHVIGHAVLFDELWKSGKLASVALYPGSEAARVSSIQLVIYIGQAHLQHPQYCMPLKYPHTGHKERHS